MAVPTGTFPLARPAAAGKYPAVVVIHENRGLNPHIEDVTRRMALAGFVAGKTLGASQIEYRYGIGISLLARMIASNAAPVPITTSGPR